MVDYSIRLMEASTLEFPSVEEQEKHWKENLRFVHIKEVTGKGYYCTEKLSDEGQWRAIPESFDRDRGPAYDIFTIIKSRRGNSEKTTTVIETARV